MKVYFKKSFNNQNLLNISIDTIQQFIRIKKLFKNEKLSISRERIIKLCKRNSKFYEKEILKHIPLQTKKYDVELKKCIKKNFIIKIFINKLLFYTFIFFKNHDNAFDY